MKKSIVSARAPQPIGPYSQAVREGKWLFLSGQIPLEAGSGEVVAGDIRSQTECILKNIEQILRAAGLSFEHVVKTTIYLKDISSFNQVNEVYASFFKPPFPARSTVEVSRLPKGVGVEIEAIAKG